MSYVQSAQVTVSGGTSAGVAYPSNVGQGKRTLAVGIFDYVPSLGGTRTISDTFTTAWNTPAAAATIIGATATAFGAWGIAPVAGGADTVTVSYSVSQTTIVLAISEYSGLNTSSPFDQGAGANDISGTSTALNSGNTPNLTGAGETVWGFGLAGTSTMTAGSNEAFALRVSVAGYATEDAVHAASGTPTSAQMTASVAANWLCVCMTFKPWMPDEDYGAPMSNPGFDSVVTVW